MELIKLVPWSGVRISTEWQPLTLLFDIIRTFMNNTVEVA